MTADSTAPSLKAIQRVGPLANGTATVFARAELHTATSKIHGVARVQTHGIAREGVSVVRSNSQITVSGTLKAPLIALQSDAQGLALGPLHFARARLTSHGDANEQHVALGLDADAGGPDVDLDTDLLLRPGLGLRGTTLNLRRGVSRISVEAARIDTGKAAFSVHGARILGLGAQTTIDAEVYPGGFSIRGRSRGLDIERLARMLGPDAPAARGRVSFDVDLVADATKTQGHAIVDVKEAELLQVRRGTLHLDAVLDGTSARADLDASAENLGTVHAFTTDLELGGKNVLAASSWRQAKGRVDLSGSADLGKLQAFLPEDPTRNVSGMLLLKASVSRTTHGDQEPDLNLALHSEDLRVRRGDFHLSGVDIQASANTGPAPARNGAALVFADGNGELLRAELRADELRPLELLAEGASARDALEAMPFELKVSAPERDLTELPEGLAVRGLRGRLGAVMAVHGPANGLRARFDAHASELAMRGAGLNVPVDAKLESTYDGSQVLARLLVRDRRAEVLSLDATARAPLAELLHETQAPFSWDADARATLTGFPLGSIVQLDRAGVRGALDGAISLKGLHKDARLSVDLRSTDLGIGDSAYKAVTLSALLDGRELRGKLVLQDAIGSLAATGRVASKWGAAVATTLRVDEGIEGELRSQDLQIAPVRAFLGDAVTELRGLLTAEAKVSIAQGKAKVLTGSVGLRDVALQVAAFPVEFRGGKATVSLSPDGVVRLSDAALYSHSGSVTAEGVAKLDGLRLASAKGSITIPKGQALPLDLNGGNLGDVYGRAELRAQGSADGQRVQVDVQVPTLRVELPLSPTRTVRDLDPLPNVHIGYRNSAGKFVSLERRRATATSTGTKGPSMHIDVAIELGKDVEVRRGSSVKVAMTGRPVLHLGEATTMTGEIRLENTSTIELQGKKFEIERGTINFVGQDPGNPLVYITAGWTAADGTRVYADFVGPLKTGKVTLRSEPARPKNEILALILLGHAEGSAATPYAQRQTSGTTTAGSAAGSLASEGLNKGLEELTGLEIATKVDTSSGNNPRPGVEVQIARSISLELSFVLGTPPPGTNPDKTFATIDWRFWRRWSLETTFGDQGSSYADLVWQYRY